MKLLLFANALMISVFSFAQIDGSIKTQKTVPTTNSPQVLSPKSLSTTVTPYDFSNVAMCVDRPDQNASLPPRNFSAVQPPPKINSDGTVSKPGVLRQPLAGETNKMWDPGTTILVYLNTNNGSDNIRYRVEKYARKWESIANIKFDFTATFNNAQIKVQFGSDHRAWSWIGRDVLYNPFKKYTMHFGTFDGNTLEIEFQRVILHEFGHALGFIHEHQSPASGIMWDKEKTYAYFALPPESWTREDVDHNVFNKYSTSTTNYSAYDKLSIMHYFIPASLTTNGVGARPMADFSPTDREYASRLYPFPPTPLNASGTLRTNDDCDLVDFVVEYNAVAADKIEFSLELGEYSAKKVTWWKQIAIPLTNNRENLLWVQNHSLIPSENRTSAAVQINFSDIDVNKSIGFWKAKFLGIHTLLGYKWNVLSALKGGCRVRLVWRKDTCA